MVQDVHTQGTGYVQGSGSPPPATTSYPYPSTATSTATSTSTATYLGPVDERMLERRYGGLCTSLVVLTLIVASLVPLMTSGLLRAYEAVQVCECECEG